MPPRHRRMVHSVGEGSIQCSCWKLGSRPSIVNQQARKNLLVSRIYRGREIELKGESLIGWLQRRHTLEGITYIGLCRTSMTVTWWRGWHIMRKMCHTPPIDSQAGDTRFCTCHRGFRAQGSERASSWFVIYPSWTATTRPHQTWSTT